MIAVDTNVLLRYLLDDDPLQSVRATRLFRAGRKSSSLMSSWRKRCGPFPAVNTGLLGKTWSE